MRLSEAIRAGAALHPQAIGPTIYEKKDSTGARTGLETCALAAAYEALGGDLEALLAPSTVPMFRQVERYLVQEGVLPDPSVKVIYPGENEKKKGTYLDLQDCICLLNDNDHWSREQIADWLEESLGY